MDEVTVGICHSIRLPASYHYIGRSGFSLCWPGYCMPVSDRLLESVAIARGYDTCPNCFIEITCDQKAAKVKAPRKSKKANG